MSITLHNRIFYFLCIHVHFHGSFQCFRDASGHFHLLWKTVSFSCPLGPGREKPWIAASGLDFYWFWGAVGKIPHLRPTPWSSPHPVSRNKKETKNHWKSNVSRLYSSWATRIRTLKWRSQSPLPYHLAIAHRINVDYYSAAYRFRQVVFLFFSKPFAGLQYMCYNWIFKKQRCFLCVIF